MTGLFDPEAFEQMPGQMSMEAVEPSFGGKDAPRVLGEQTILERVDRWGNEHRRTATGAKVVIGHYENSTLVPNIVSQSVTFNGRSTWGSRLTCKRCGTQHLACTGSSVSYEDGPYHFSRGHECKP